MIKGLQGLKGLSPNRFIGISYDTSSLIWQPQLLIHCRISFLK